MASEADTSHISRGGLHFVICITNQQVFLVCVYVVSLKERRLLIAISCRHILISSEG